MSRTQAYHLLRSTLGQPSALHASSTSICCDAACTSTSSSSSSVAKGIRNIYTAVRGKPRGHQKPKQEQQEPIKPTYVPPMPRAFQHMTKRQVLESTAMPPLNPQGPMQALASSSRPTPPLATPSTPSDATTTTTTATTGAAISSSHADPSTAPQAPFYDDQPVWEQLLGQGSSDARRMELARLLRRYNYSLPGLHGQAVQATVLRVSEDKVLVDPGFYGVAEIPRSEVTIAALCTPSPSPSPSPSSVPSPSSALATTPSTSSQPGATPASASPPAPASAPHADRTGITDIRPGDVVSLRVEALFTPFGDMALSIPPSDATARLAATWRDLADARAARRPVLGRILNACTGGYAVGIGGIVALMPYGRFTMETASAVGVLQQFYVETVDPERRLLTVADVRKGDSRRLV